MFVPCGRLATAALFTQISVIFIHLVIHSFIHSFNHFFKTNKWQNALKLWHQSGGLYVQIVCCANMQKGDCCGYYSSHSQVVGKMRNCINYGLSCDLKAVVVVMFTHGLDIELSARFTPHFNFPHSAFYQPFRIHFHIFWFRILLSAFRNSAFYQWPHSHTWLLERYTSNNGFEKNRT